MNFWKTRYVTPKVILGSHNFFTLKDAPDILLVVQDSNDAYCVLFYKIVNPDGLKPNQWPRT
jgi:hypothetical protein